MRSFQSIMATVSLTSLLLEAASSRSLFALHLSRSSSATAARLPSSFSHPSHRSRSRRGNPAFQNNGGAFRRQFFATVFSDAASPRTPSAPTPLGSASAASPVEGTGLDPAPDEEPRRGKPVPTILLAGFLGSGKTSALKHLLENNSKIKIGTIVNDVASVNIDAKLISNANSRRGDGGNTPDGHADGVVELQNGCACCSLADELFDSVVRLTRGGTRELDAIVVELSGVADPVAVRDNWERAQLRGHPVTRLASLTRTVTLVDACTFGTDWMSWDAAGERPAWTEGVGDCAAARKVPELLAEQVEAADLLLVNKIDLAGEAQVGVASGVARGLNSRATVMEVEFGRVDAEELLGAMLGEDEVEEVDGEEDAHSHGHEHSSHNQGQEHSSHDHHHEHSSKHDHEAAEAILTDTSHSNSHEGSSSECDDPDCTDSSHSHSHDHSPECDDPDCTDAPHSHSHEHKSTAATKLGISSFVYRSSTPFNSRRLAALLDRWPVPIKDSLELGGERGEEEAGGGGGETASDRRPAFSGVLRSKGFCWMAPAAWSAFPGGDAWRHDTVMFWSHAGKHFGITPAGKWRGSPTEDRTKPHFAGDAEAYDRVLCEDWVSEEWGDRRQELVFIGTNLDEEVIREALDECICTEEEMDAYRAQLRKYLETSTPGW